MAEEPLEPLSDFAASLVAAEAKRPGPPPDAEARLLLKVKASAAVVGTSFFAGKALGIALGVVVGGLLGAAGAAWLLHDRVVTVPLPVVVVQRAEPRPATVVMVPYVVPVPIASPPPSAAVPVAPVAPVAEPKKLGDAIAAENALLERARTALMRGEATAALEAIDQHAARFANGQLAEEREALAVQALVSARRVDEATERARQFRAKYPSSLLGAAVDAALNSAP